MQSFTYQITDPVGIHARPAGMLAREARKFGSEIIIAKDEKRANAQHLMAVMGLGVGHGDAITVSAEGADEAQAAAEMEKFFKENL